MPVAQTAPRVVVLGGTGYIGSTVAGSLRVAGAHVRVVGRSGSALSSGQEAVAADITNKAELSRAIRDVDVVVHLVARMDATHSWRLAQDDVGIRTNVGSVIDLVDVMTSAPHPPLVVTAGSVTQVGRPGCVRVDGSEPDRPESDYDIQKLTAEHAFLQATREGKIRAVPFRLPTVYGVSASTARPGTGVVVGMMRRALSGEPLTIWNDGTVARDLLHVADVAQALTTAAMVPREDETLIGQPWLLGTGHGLLLSELFRAIADTVGIATGSPPVDVVQVPPPHYADPVDRHSYEVDASAFSRATGWRPQTDLQTGLTTLAHWLMREDGNRGRRVLHAV